MTSSSLSLIGFFIIGLVILFGAVLSYQRGKLTLPASIVAGLVGVAVFAGGGYAGFVMLTAFFVLGVLSTKHQKDLKALLPGSATHTERRQAGQVLANGGVAALLGILAIVDHERKDLYLLMMAASLSSAAADTSSSELGMVYGRRFFNILTFRSDRRGLDGVISIEGTLLGVAGSALIAFLYCLFEGWGASFLLIVAAGTFGNLLDSLLGATLERRHILHNDAVNFINTLAAALLVLLF